MLDRTRARTAWANGVRALRQDVATASREFRRAVDIDDGMSDAWLGLHATGTEPDTAVIEMARHQDRFGEERQRQQLPLRSRFRLGYYIDHRLETHSDLWGAVTAYHLGRREFDAARSAVAHVGQGVCATYLHGRVAFDTGDFDAAIGHLHRLVAARDTLFEAEGRFLYGISLAAAGASAPAKEQLRWVVQQRVLTDMHAEALYALGRLLREEGATSAALEHLQQAFARRPDLPGLRLLMAQTSEELHAQAAPAGAALTEMARTARPGDGESVEDVLADLDRQIGQHAIKRQVRLLLARTRAGLARKEAGLPQSRMTEHFVFTGPPGTGKTTIARVVARLYRALGVLEKGHVVEVDRSGLIGKDHGHTVARTTERIDEALGGVLFVDEAYALRTEGFESGDPFGQGVIDTLIKRMEDDRDRLVVIAAGYPEPMERFLDSNPGLRSRFTTTIGFTAYSPEELVAIGRVMAGANSDELTPEACAALLEQLTDLQARGVFDSPSFGNARYVRTVVEKAAAQRDLRLFSGVGQPSISEMVRITDNDLRTAVTELQ